MKLARPQWNLLSYILPPIFSSLIFIIFFPAFLFQLLIGISIFSAVLGGWAVFKSLRMSILQTKSEAKKNRILSLFGLIFLLGISSVFFIFLTAASQLAPERLAFGEIVGTWQITFPAGICFLIAQIIAAFLSPKKIVKAENNALKREKKTKIHRLLFGKNAAIAKKMQLSNQIFLQLTELLAIIISLSIVILSVANGLGRWIGFEVPSGFQLQTIIGSTLIYLPFATRRWRKRKFLKARHSRVYRLFRLAIGLIIAIVLLSALTFPLTNKPISVQFLSYGLTTFQWELFILAWWIGITPLIASQIIHLCKASLLQILMVLIVSSGIVYGICAEFLMHAGEEYFLAVIREGILALILTALPIAGLILTVLPFHKMTEMELIDVKQKQSRNQEYLTHSLMQATVIACVLYWVSGLSILFVLFLMLAAPWAMRFLFRLLCEGI